MVRWLGQTVAGLTVGSQLLWKNRKLPSESGSGGGPLSTPRLPQVVEVMKGLPGDSQLVRLSDVVMWIVPAPQ